MKVKDLLKLVDTHNENSKIFGGKYAISFYCNDILELRKIKSSKSFKKLLKETYPLDFYNDIMNTDFMVSDGCLSATITIFDCIGIGWDYRIEIYISLTHEEY